MSIVVDLPAPLGPSSAAVSPASDRDVDAAHRADRALRAPVGLSQAVESDAAVGLGGLRGRDGRHRVEPDEPYWPKPPQPVAETKRSSNDYFDGSI